MAPEVLLSTQQFLDNTAALDRSIKAFSYSNLTLNYALRHVLGKEINFGIQGLILF